MRTFRTFTVLMAGLVAAAGLIILGLPGGLGQNTPSEAASLSAQPIDLGTLGGGSSYASAVNNNGQVVGSSASASGQERAFFWTLSGGMIDLGSLGWVFRRSSATAVNDAGQVIGSIYTDDTTYGVEHAFFWTQAGGMIDLGSLGGYPTHANAINASGQVVGSSYTATGNMHAFSWTQAEGMIDLGTLDGGSWSVALSVNDGGQVVGAGISGRAFFYNVGSPFSWTREGGMIEIMPSFGEAVAVNNSGQVAGTGRGGSTCGCWAFLWTETGDSYFLGFNPGGSIAINQSGQVVGWLLAGSYCCQAFSWTPAGGMINLGTLGGDYTNAGDVNDSGLVVGRSWTASGLVHAFAWTQAGGMVDLGTLGGDYSSASAINEAGQVVGESNNAAGAYHATLWNVQSTSSEPPVWDPSTGSLTVHAGDDAAIFLDASDPNPTDVVTISSLDGLPVGMSCTYYSGNPATGECHWTPTEAQLGTHLVDFVATDSGGLQSPIHTVTIDVIAPLPVYLAIGDSVATGCSMESNPDDEEICPKAVVSYPERLWSEWAQLAPGLQLVDLTLWGQTAEYFAEGGGRSDVEQALDRKPKVVTITLGANDFNFLDFQYWLVGRDKKWQESVVSDRAVLLGLRLEKLIRLIRLKSPDAVVFVTGYPNPFTPGECGTARSYFDLLFYNRGNRDGINDALKRVAEKFSKTYFVPLDKGGFQQHTMASKSSWYFGTQCQLDVKTAVYCAVGIDRPLCDPHPNQEGAKAIAEAIRRRLIVVPDF